MVAGEEEKKKRFKEKLERKKRLAEKQAQTYTPASVGLMGKRRGSSIISNITK